MKISNQNVNNMENGSLYKTGNYSWTKKQRTISLFNDLMNRFKCNYEKVEKSSSTGFYYKSSMGNIKLNLSCEYYQTHYQLLILISKLNKNYLLMSYFRNSERTQKPSSKSPQKKALKESNSVTKWKKNKSPQSARVMPQNEEQWSETMDNFLRDLLNEQNKSMQDMLNSSINHFTRFIEEHQDIENQNHQLKQQNKCLKHAIDELRIILKQKLEKALKKQREDLNIMMQDYIQLIQKLLKDKQSLALKMEEVMKSSAKVKEQNEELAKLLDSNIQLTMLLKQKDQKSKILLQQKDKDIQSLQKEIQSYKNSIQESEGRFKLILKEKEQFKVKIAALQQRKVTFSEEQEQKEDNASQKTKLLLDMLLQSQEQMKKLRQKLRDSNNSNQKNQLLEQLQQRIRSIQQQHEQQFKQYDQSMRQMLQTKDEHIQRLNKTIEHYRKQLKH